MPAGNSIMIVFPCITSNYFLKLFTTFIIFLSYQKKVWKDLFVLIFTLSIPASNYSAKNMPNICKKDMSRCEIYSSLTLILSFDAQFLVKSLSFYSIFIIIVFEYHYSFAVSTPYFSKSLSLVAIIRIPANMYLFKVNSRNIRKRYKICSKLTIKTPERRHWRQSGVFIVNFEYFIHFSSVSLVNLEQITVS